MASQHPPAPPEPSDEVDAPDPAPRRSWLEEEPRLGQEADIGSGDDQVDPGPPERG